MCRTCKVEGCNGKHKGHGYCNKHYQQFKKYGYIPERNKFSSNEIIVYEDYAEIILTDNKGEETGRAIIDIECVDLIKDYKWCLNGGYVHNRKIGLLHRLLMNPEEQLVVDHVNRNKLDNRRCNLRICTVHQNTMNQSVRNTNTSGTTGVYWSKRKNKWQARIFINGKDKCLGYFESKEEAARARRQAEIDYFGEYAPNIED